MPCYRNLLHFWVKIFRMIHGNEISLILHYDFHARNFRTNSAYEN